MRSLKHNPDRRSILARLAALRPDQPARWGRMSAHQMICHLSDSYLAGMGEKHVSMATGVVQRTVMKFGALYVPLRWPRGIATRPEMDQQTGGTRPAEFEADRRKLIAIIGRFSAANRGFTWARHPLFDEMRDSEWLRWGYLHADHHLRQFGC